MITELKSRKALIGIIAAVILVLGLVCGGITIAGNTPGRRADKYLDLGGKYLSELDYKQALVAYRQVLEIEPKNLDAYKGGLAAYEGLGDREGMAEFYVDALGVIESLTEKELKPVYDTAVEIYLCADAVYSEDHEAAAQALERSYDTLGGEERIIRALIAEYGILAGVYIDTGDYEKEQEIYRKILAKGLENADALSGWEQRVRERFQEYLSRNRGSGNASEPTVEPTTEPTPEPTAEPTSEPTPEPTAELTPEPTPEPTAEPTAEPTPEPTAEPTSEPTAEPTPVPTPEATTAPAPDPTPIVLQGNVKDSGEYKGLNWQVTDAGELAVTGHMEVEGLDSESVWLDAPWKQYSEETTIAYMSFTGAKSLHYLFGVRKTLLIEYVAGSKVLLEVNMSGLDTSSVTDMSEMFAGCESLSSVDVSGFDTSNVTNMSEMFAGCNSLSSVDVSGFDTSNVTTMVDMFYDCRSLSSVDVSGFDTSSVTNMMDMFYDCWSLGSVDVSGFDTSSVKSMGYMFYGCGSLSSLDLSSFNTGSVTNMAGMFNGCSSLSSLNLSSFDTGSVTNMAGMFIRCSSLSSLDLSSFDTGSVTNMGNMFNNCSSLQEILVGDHWLVPAKANGMFEGCGISAVTQK